MNDWGGPRALFLAVKPEKSMEDKTSISLSPSRLFIAARIKVGMTEVHWAMTSETELRPGPSAAFGSCGQRQVAA